MLETHFGNPSSLHSYGRAAQQHLEVARYKVAQLIGAKKKNVIFTSGGTEADNLAIMGTAFSYRERGRHIITSTIEHHAVLDTCEMLSYNGFDVTFLPVDKDGVVDPDDVKRAIRRDTILITIMHANNEIGTIEPIPEIGRIAREHLHQKDESNAPSLLKQALTAFCQAHVQDQLGLALKFGSGPLVLGGGKT